MYRWNKGFTLIELLVTLAVAAIALGIAVPSFKSTIVNNRSLSMGDEMVVALNFARSEAIKRGARVSICPSLDAASCSTATNWAKGWIVFVDNVPSDATVAPVVGMVLRVWSDLPKQASVSLITGSTSLDYLRFTGSGMLARQKSTDTLVRVFTLAVTGCVGRAQTAVTVGLSGMLAVAKTDCP